MKQYKLEKDDDNNDFVIYSDHKRRTEKTLSLPTLDHYFQVRDLLAEAGYTHQNTRDYKSPHKLSTYNMR
jgi:myo-inositol catabolism protein IolC